jgi:hypothetical protein
MSFDVENECIRIKFQECNIRDFFDEEHKRSLFFGNFSSMLIWKNTSNANLLDVFINNWLNQFSSSYEFLKSRLWSPKGPLMLRHKW